MVPARSGAFRQAVNSQIMLKLWWETKEMHGFNLGWTSFVVVCGGQSLSSLYAPGYL